MLAVALILLAQVAPSDALDKDITTEKVFAKKEPETPDGWRYNLTIGATGSMTRSTNVVGTVNGTTAQAGVLVDGGATLKHGLNSWENAIKLTESFTRTPTIPHFLKSADELRLQSTYLHRFEAIEWLGPYARFLGTTSIFRGWTVPASNITIFRHNVGGSTTILQKAAGQKYGLTKPFEPSLLRQSLGMFANALEGKEISLRTRAGAAAQEIINQSGYALAADDPTTVSPVDGSAAPDYQQLRTSIQGGAEFGAETLGTIVENITYTGRADFFYPIWESNASQVTGSKLQTDISAKLSFHMSKFVSLDYVLSAKKIPAIVGQWQVTNGILLSIAATLLDSTQPAAPPPPSEAAATPPVPPTEAAAEAAPAQAPPAAPAPAEETVNG